MSKGYEPKGEYVTVDGTKVYATGPSNAKKAILVIYDVFGYFPQTIQGADILAYSDKEQPYKVFIPDILDAKAEVSWFPPDTKEKGEKLGHFFKTAADISVLLPKVPKIREALQKQNPEIEAWGLVGYCFGGKIANLSSQEGTPFKAAASCHPARVDPADAPGTTIPFAMLPSMDEDKEAVENWQKGMKVKNIVEWFPDQVHGWMAARADLEDEKVCKEYERGYKTLLEFFHEHL